MIKIAIITFLLSDLALASSANSPEQGDFRSQRAAPETIIFDNLPKANGFYQIEKATCGYIYNLRMGSYFRKIRKNGNFRECKIINSKFKETFVFACLKPTRTMYIVSTTKKECEKALSIYKNSIRN